MNVTMEQRWRDNWQEKNNALGQQYLPLQFNQNKSYMNNRGFETGPPRWEVGD